MICVFDIGNENFSGNGDAVLTPLAGGTMKIVAGGAYEADIRHPIDADGKWTHLVPGAIVRLPVPREVIENAFIGIEVDVYRTTVATQLRAGPSEPTRITYDAWVSGTAYPVGKKVTSNNQNYELTAALTGSEIYADPSVVSKWKTIANYTGGSAVLMQLPYHTELYYISDAGSGWYKMSTPMGIEGYVKSDRLEFVRHMTPSPSDERVITEQLFRIKDVKVDIDAHVVDVYATHVSNDLGAILIKDVDLSQNEPAMAITRMVDGLMYSYRGDIATNLSADDNGTYTGSLNGKTGLFAILDPSAGFVSTFDARFTRDNWDLFILQRTNTDKGLRIEYGANARGIVWSRSSEEIVTRVVPVAKNAEGKDLYLETLWVDSPLINDYPVIHMERLPVQGQVGKDDGTGTNTVWTDASLRAEMLKKAQERYSVDHVDEVAVEVTVNFQQTGCSEELAWMKPFQEVNLYDVVTCMASPIGMSVKLSVTEIEWDYIQKRIVGIKACTTRKYTSPTVTGYNVANNSITTAKLTTATINEIANLIN